ncbi:MAG TPA: aryl-sulfate sulfotransferase [Chloroflexota bacterium]|nr:aryl-sulfate sulfotransferase [Chloroflexota bacterium]
MEQLKAKRAGIGLRGRNRDQAFDGYTLFAPNGDEGLVVLIDMEGQVAHEWRLPSKAWCPYLTPDRTLLCNIRTKDETQGRFIEEQPWKCGALMELDWQGNVLWEVRHPDHHHDGIRLASGNVLLLCLTELPADIAATVQGGKPGTEHEGKMHADYLVEMTTAGETVWEWRVWEHLDPASHPIVNIQDERKEWTHGNAVAELPNGDVVVSFREISTVVIVDKSSGDVRWELGPPVLNNQHAPSPLPNGNLLIFDNGTHRLESVFPYSRVIEVDPRTSEIVWSYQDTPAMAFYSPMISNAQRLPNGNTLVNEGNFGRLFEVTSEGEIVWEYVSPWFAGQPPRGPNNQVFRAYRCGPEIMPA